MLWIQRCGDFKATHQRILCSKLQVVSIFATFESSTDPFYLHVRTWMTRYCYRYAEQKEKRAVCKFACFFHQQFLRMPVATGDITYAIATIETMQHSKSVRKLPLWKWICIFLLLSHRIPSMMLVRSHVTSIWCNLNCLKIFTFIHYNSIFINHTTTQRLFHVIDHW